MTPDKQKGRESMRPKEEAKLFTQHPQLFSLGDERREAEDENMF